MVLRSHPRLLLSVFLGVGAALLTGCAQPGASPYSPGMPSNGAGEPVDPQTGLVLPGIQQGGNGGI